MDAETEEGRRVRMYSGGYANGQRLSSHIDPMHENAMRLMNEGLDPYLVNLGLVDYRQGFSDGWHGRVPRIELRIPTDGLP